MEYQKNSKQTIRRGSVYFNLVSLKKHSLI